MAKAMLDGELMHPSEYVAAVELKGKDVAVTITKVERAELMVVGGAKKPGIIVHFKESPKKFVLNKTNAGTIADMHGTKAEEWTGKRITLFPTTCKCKGKTVECIRVRETAPPPKQGKAEPAPVADGCAPGNPGCSQDLADYATVSGKRVCANHAT